MIEHKLVQRKQSTAVGDSFLPTQSSDQVIR